MFNYIKILCIFVVGLMWIYNPQTAEAIAVAPLLSFQSHNLNTIAMAKKENYQKYYRTKKGLIANIYSTQRFKSKKRNYPLPVYTLEELRKWALSQSIFHKLFNEWVNSGYKHELVPSIDRLDDYKSYTFDNLQVVTWGENNNNYLYNVRNGINNKNRRAVLQYSLDGEFLNEYPSIKDAMRKTGVNHVSAVCRGVLNKSGECIWKYKNKTLRP